MSDEYYYAILGLNTNPTGTNTVNNVALPAGQIWKIAGTTTGATAPYCVNGTNTTAGCTSGVYATGVQANADMIRGVYSVAADGKGNLFSGEEYYNAVFGINAAGVVSTVAGIPNNAAKTVKRAPAGSFGIGSVFGVAADTLSNVYFTDASNGVIWRVDAAGKLQYPVAGGATTFCAAATDAYGDGCPALQAKIGSSGSNNFASTTLPGPGAYGISVDANANLFFGDTETNLIREVASGTQFGNVGGNQSTTQTLDIHFAVSDVAASGAPYTITAGTSIFTLGTATCTTNPDATTDCLLPLTATPTTLGAFSGTLQVKSSLGGVASFALGGTAISTPVTRTSISYTAGSVCAGTSTYSTTTPVTFVATITSTGSPTGTVQFLANGVNIGTPQAVSGGMATLTGFLFSNPGAYKVTAIYSGDTYFKASTSVTPATLSTAAPSFSTAANTGMQSTVAAGQTALYSFNVLQNVYTGTITLACSGLPANASCSFSPSSLTGTGCSVTNTVALSILTQQATVVTPGGFGASGGGWWSVFSIVPGVLLALLVGLRRRGSALRGNPVWQRAAMLLALALVASGTIACGSGAPRLPATPSGNYTITVTSTGSTGTSSVLTLPLTVK